MNLISSTDCQLHGTLLSCRLYELFCPFNSDTMNTAGIWIFLIVLLLIIPAVSAGVPTTGHPYMLFHDINDTPGYQYRTIAPWKTWEGSVISQAATSPTRTPSALLKPDPGISGNINDEKGIEVLYRNLSTADKS